MKLRIERETRAFTSARWRYEARGYQLADHGANEITVAWECDERLAVGSWAETADEYETVREDGSDRIVPFKTGRVFAHDRATGLQWEIVETTLNRVISHDGVSRLQSELAPPCGCAAGGARVYNPDAAERVDTAFAERLARQEAQAMAAAIERAAQAAKDLGAELVLERAANFTGAGGESPYVLKVKTARGSIEHRKRHGESWDEAVKAIGL